tara:strand:- start:65 stop:442 length:378 start_codon:yes stop_codon:yes gene_type:complete
MSERKEEIYSKSLRAGRRTYFFDVRATRANDYYLTITESKREFNEDGSPYYKKHKIYLYKEDFKNFTDHLNEMTKYIISEKGEEIISLNQKENIPDPEEESSEKEASSSKKFTEVNFEDLGNNDK